MKLRELLNSLWSVVQNLFSKEDPTTKLGPISVPKDTNVTIKIEQK